MKFEEFALFMNRMRFYFKSGGPNLEEPEEVKAWFDALKDIATEDFKRACVTARDNCEFFPTIAKFRQLAGVGSFNEAEGITQRIFAAFKTSNIEARNRSVGPIGFEIVQEYGGWDAMNTSCNVENALQFNKMRLDVLKKCMQKVEDMRAKENSPENALYLLSIGKSETTVEEKHEKYNQIKPEFRELMSRMKSERSA